MIDLVIGAIIGGIAGYILQISADKICNLFENERKYHNSNPVLSIIISMTLTVFIIYLWGVTPQSISAIIFVYALINLTIIDIRLQILPDIITYPLLIIGLIVNYFTIHIDFKSAIIGGIAGFLSLWIVNTLFRLLRNKNGMGVGDFKLYAAIGAWLGWQSLPLVIMLSSLLGVLFAIISTVIGRKSMASRMPFGPYLSVAAIVSLFYGQEIMQWYLGVVL